MTHRTGLRPSLARSIKTQEKTRGEKVKVRMGVISAFAQPKTGRNSLISGISSTDHRLGDNFCKSPIISEFFS